MPHSARYLRVANATHSYIGRKPCGCVVALVVDAGDKHTGDSVADFIRDGLTVERVTMNQARELLDYCKCEPVQGDMFDE